MISIVMAYYNRKQLLLNTLNTIMVNDDVEIIIVDDCSTDGQDITYLESDNIHVITLKNKTWKNPCIAYNTGFKHAKGDIILIQNAECLHMGDILGYVRKHLKNNLYINFSAYSINEEQTKRISEGDAPKSVIQPLLDQEALWGETGWYNHVKHNCKFLHFCSAITKKDLYDLGGFDERYANGYGFEDNDFIYRIRNRKRMRIRIVESFFVVHQHHSHASIGNVKDGMQINKALLIETKKMNGYDVKPFNIIYN